MLENIGHLEHTQESLILDEASTNLECAQEPEHAPEFILRVLDMANCKRREI